LLFDSEMRTKAILALMLVACLNAASIDKQNANILFNPACTDPNCMTCDADPICTACEPLYVLIDPTTCTLCTDLVANCATCNPDKTCQTCLPDYVPVDTTTCTLCTDLVANCATCNPDKTCAACAVGYYASVDLLTCSLCSDTITQCAECADAANLTCSKCNTNFYLQNNKCVDCVTLIPFCDTCNPDNTCAACAVGYYASIDSLTCLKCSDTILDCAECSDVTNLTCSKCMANFYLQNNKCVDCVTLIPFCDTCNPDSTCAACAVGYYASVDLLTCNLCSDTIV
jgi:proprotein convertase subtilisin/kexin type 5